MIPNEQQNAEVAPLAIRKKSEKDTKFCTPFPTLPWLCWNLTRETYRTFARGINITISHPGMGTDMEVTQKAEDRSRSKDSP